MRGYIACPNPANGAVAWTNRRRITSYLEPDLFELMREIALERGIGMGALAKEWLEEVVLQRAARS